MNELKYYINKLIKKPLSSNFINKVTNNNINIYTYEELTKFNNIFDAFGNKKFIILLFEIKNNFGHYCLLSNYKNHIEFFDSYGNMSHKILKEIPINFRSKKNMIFPHLVYLLYNSKKKIEYNNYNLQSEKPQISTCGYYCILKYYYYKLNVNQFANLFNNKFFNPDELVIIYFCLLNKY